MEEVPWNGNDAEARHEVAAAEGLEHQPGMPVEKTSHAEHVDEHPAREHGDAIQLGLLRVGVRVDVLEDRLAQGEDKESGQEPGLPVQERTRGHTGPNEVADINDNWMADDLRVFSMRDPLQGLGETAIVVRKHVPDVVIHTPHRPLREARAPNETVKEHRQ